MNTDKADPNEIGNEAEFVEDGAGLHVLAPNGIHSSWSPDGTKLAYICTTSVAWDPVHLCVMNADR